MMSVFFDLVVQRIAATGGKASLKLNYKNIPSLCSVFQHSQLHKAITNKRMCKKTSGAVTAGPPYI